LTRVAYLSADPGVRWGGEKGAAIHVAELVRALAAEGAEVLLITAGVAPGAAQPPPGVKLERLPGPESAAAAERLRAAALQTAYLVRRLRRFGAELLYERLALHCAVGSSAAMALGIPHLVELNAPLVEEAARFRRLEEEAAALMLEGAVLRNAELVLAVSEPLAEYALTRGARRVEVHPNAVSMDRFPEPVAQGGVLAPAVFAGAIRPWHGAQSVAEAWRLLGSLAPPLLVVGDGPGRTALEDAGARVTGWVPHDDVPALLGVAQIGLAPYAADAPPYFSPLKLFEYLAAGLAVVAGELPGVTRVVDPRSAVLVPPGEPHALARAVAELARDPARRARLGEAGRNLVVSRHTWQRRASDVLRAALAVPHG
jgi:glycosyltransferase involved in cell wall biosynthesis